MWKLFAFIHPCGLESRSRSNNAILNKSGQEDYVLFTTLLMTECKALQLCKVADFEQTLRLADSEDVSNYGCQKEQMY